MNDSIRPARPVLFLLLAVFLLAVSTESSVARPGPENDLKVKSHSWKSHGAGRLAELREITIENSGGVDYENIEIRVDLFTARGKFSGSLRGTLDGPIAAGSEKTFFDVSLGLMNTVFGKSEVSVKTARESQRHSTESASDAIVVKDWGFESGIMGSEGFITEITLENITRRHFRNIRILFTETAADGSALREHSSVVVIRDFLPAGTEKTFSNLNAVFSLPGARQRSVTVSGAERISAKELGYLAAEAGREKTSRKKRPAREAAEVSPARETAEAFSTETSGKYEELEGSEREELVALPERDIKIRSFRWETGIPGSMGILSELALENAGDVAYGKIQFKIEFFSDRGSYLGSNRFKVDGILSPGQTMSLENVSVGFINKLHDPKRLRLKVYKAKAL